MTLLITLAAGIIAAIIRIVKPDFAIANKVGFLALMYLGASLMWCIDGIASLASGEAFIELADRVAVIDDTKLGLSVALLGLVVWFVVRAAHRATAKKNA
jgi:uncharacterized membrane protein